MTASWPGFTSAPCDGCGCPGASHQPRCMHIVERRGRREHCGCPGYTSTTTQQPALFEVT